MSSAWIWGISGWGNWYLLFPLLFAVWIAWGDIRTRRIPNYLTLTIALAGLGFHAGFQGLSGVLQSVAGLAVGFGLLLIPYLLGGMGAGDVKALAALGAWLGPALILILFFYMALAGGLLSLIVLWRRGLLKIKFKQWWNSFKAFVLRRPGEKGLSHYLLHPTPGIPYGLAIALGMAALFFRGASL